MLALLVAVAVAGPSLEQVQQAAERSAAHRSLRVSEVAPAIPASAYEQVAAGEVATGLEAVEGHGSKKAWGMTVLAHPIDALWDAINDETNHPGYTQIRYSELVSGAVCRSGRRVMQVLPVGVPFVSDRWWITVLTANDALHRATDGAVRELAWTSSVDPSEITSERGRAELEGAVPIAFSRGGWLLSRVDSEHTLLEYTLWTDPGGRLPSGALSAFASSSIEKAFDAMDRYARDGRSRCR